MAREWLSDIKHYFRQRMTLQEALIFLFFLVIASLIWYGHAMNSVRSATLPVAVSYKDIPDNILFSDTLPDVIHIEIRDAGRRLKAYANHLEVSFDLSQQIKGDQGKVHITADLLRSSVTTILQGTTKLQNVQPEQISGTYYRQHSKDVPIHLFATPTPATQYQLVGDPLVEPHKVTIYGNKKQLDTIHCLVTKPLVLADIKDTVQTSVELDVPAGLRVKDKRVAVTYIAEQFTEKVLTLPIATRGVPANTHLRLFPSEVTVYLRVGVAHFNSINPQEITVYCDYPQNNEEKLPVNIRCTNSYVTYRRCTPASVEFIIEK